MDEEHPATAVVARLNVLRREVSADGIRSVLLDLDVAEPDGTRTRQTFSIPMTMDLMSNLGLWFFETAAMARALDEQGAESPTLEQVSMVSEVRVLAGPWSPVAVLEAEPDGVRSIRLGVPYPQLLDLRASIEEAVTTMTRAEGLSH